MAEIWTTRPTAHPRSKPGPQGPGFDECRLVPGLGCIALANLTTTDVQSFLTATDVVLAG
jgi:hypothetical protein